MDGVVHREAGPDTWGTWNLYSEGVCFSADCPCDWARVGREGRSVAAWGVKVRINLTNFPDEAGSPPLSVLGSVRSLQGAPLLGYYIFIS